MPQPVVELSHLRVGDAAQNTQAESVLQTSLEKLQMRIVMSVVGSMSGLGSAPLKTGTTIETRAVTPPVLWQRGRLAGERDVRLSAASIVDVAPRE